MQQITHCSSLQRDHRRVAFRTGTINSEPEVLKSKLRTFKLWLAWLAIYPRAKFLLPRFSTQDG